MVGEGGRVPLLKIIPFSWPASLLHVVESPPQTPHLPLVVGVSLSHTALLHGRGSHQSSFLHTSSIRPPSLPFCSPKKNKYLPSISAQIALQDLRFMPHSSALCPGPSHAQPLAASHLLREKSCRRQEVEQSAGNSRGCWRVEPARGLGWEQSIE